MNTSPLVVSMGDPCGIGPDIILQTWKKRNSLDIPEFVVSGDADVIRQRAALLGLEVSIEEVGRISQSGSGNLVVVAAGKPASGIPAKPTAEDAAATIAAIDLGVDMVVEGLASALVTAPINKETLYAVGFSHPGHTEYLAELALHALGKEVTPVMMIAGPELRTIPVTIHIPLSEVRSVLSTDLILETVRIAARDLANRFALRSPRIVVAGLNPHAGENGTIGMEDEEIVAPAVEKLRAEGIDVKGPLPADTLFHDRARKAYDLAVCMYHDQALIPAKTLGFDESVNVTLGLPFVRTSPDHGTAYDIAGTGKSNPESFIAALKMAEEMVKASR